MDYTPVVLFALGILGILLHNLVELNKINRKTGGNAKIGNYIKLELYSILISILMVSSAVMVSQEIKQLESVGKWLGLGFIAIGYMGQSVLILFMGKAAKTIGIDEDKPDKKE